MIRRAALLFVLVLGGCVQQGDDRRIDERLMAALGQARALHHLADVHLSEGEPDKALAALERILEIEFPPGAPERDDVVVDAHGRIAKIQLGAGRIDEAMAALERGHAESRRIRRDTFYGASLHLIEGEVHEARSKKARDDGDEPAAKAEARRAIESYEESIAVNQRVMDRIAQETKEGTP